MTEGVRLTIFTEFYHLCIERKEIFFLLYKIITTLLNNIDNCTFGNLRNYRNRYTQGLQ